MIFAGLSVKRSSNSQTLKTMLANGSVITRNGCDTLSGPTCRDVRLHGVIDFADPCESMKSIPSVRTR